MIAPIERTDLGPVGGASTRPPSGRSRCGAVPFPVRHRGPASSALRPRWELGGECGRSRDRSRVLPGASRGRPGTRAGGGGAPAGV